MDILSTIIFGLIVITCMMVISIMVGLYADHTRRKRREEVMIQKRTVDTSQRIIYGALKKANSMLVDAELQGITTIAHKKIEAEKFEDAFETALTNTLSTTLSEVKNATETIEKTYNAFLNDARTLIDSRITEHMKELDNTMKTIQSSTREIVQNEVDSQVANNVTHLETYRRNNEQILDEHTIDIVIATTKRVISEGLTAQQHTKLILESLEKARNQNVFSHD